MTKINETIECGNKCPNFQQKYCPKYPNKGGCWAYSEPLAIVKDSRKDDFLELWEMGMKFFKMDKPNWKFRFCPKSGTTVLFSDLINLGCWSCDEYVCNEGNCDCI